MIFNGLKGCDLVTFNYLHQADLPARISIEQIARETTYDPWTIKKSINRLETWGLIARHRQSNGQAYTFEILDSERIAK